MNIKHWLIAIAVGLISYCALSVSHQYTASVKKYHGDYPITYGDWSAKPIFYNSYDGVNVASISVCPQAACVTLFVKDEDKIYPEDFLVRTSFYGREEELTAQRRELGSLRGNSGIMDGMIIKNSLLHQEINERMGKIKSHYSDYRRRDQTTSAVLAAIIFLYLVLYRKK